MPYPFKKRNLDTTKPYIADNLYAADRTPPPQPWRPANTDERSMEEIRLTRAKLEEQKPVTEEDSSAVADEFNKLSSLILPPDQVEDDFSLNLFNTVSQTAGQQAAFSQSKAQV